MTSTHTQLPERAKQAERPTGDAVRVPVFSTVLVANRGEIAVRVIRTLRAMGIRPVAVYSDADAGARHVREADEAVRIGSADAAGSYLSIEAVLDAARRTGAQAIHPGYGFLSENADFARACAEDGLVFIGPPPDAIESMGDKVRAKRLVAEHGVPVNAGVDERDLDDDALTAAAERLGFPVLVKPSAGGGGMGMVEVRAASELPAALRTARRVATAAFGDDALFLERLIDTPRHIEVQVLADAHGNVVHLGERECSLQRRHQKVIEECPSPMVDEPLRQRMGAAACEVARTVGYTGVGTVEFLVSAHDPDTFSFMEMNTRLQVEHPVTELVAGIRGSRGIDLVEQQVLVAAGEPLSFEQDDVRLTGSAVEARVYAEDPTHDFLPATGRVLALREPHGDGIRVDSALEAGLTVTGDYDPMLAKVIAWGRDRAEAVARLSAALSDTSVLGIVTNVPFLRSLVDDPDVRAGRIDTGLISRMLEHPVDVDATLPPEVLAAAALLVHDEAWRLGTDAPWSRPTGWRLEAPAPVRRTFAHHGAEFTVELVGAPEASAVRIGDGNALRARLLDRSGERMLVECDDRTFAFVHARSGDTVWLAIVDASATATSMGQQPGGPWALRLLPGVRSAADRGAHAQASDSAADPQLRSPMPGTVVSIEVADGDAVEAGTGILVIEAMKMEHRVAAPLAGVVRLAVRVGEHVAAEHPLAVIEPLVPTRDDDNAALTRGGTLAADDRRAIPTTEGRS